RRSAGLRRRHRVSARGKEVAQARARPWRIFSRRAGSAGQGAQIDSGRPRSWPDAGGGTRLGGTGEGSRQATAAGRNYHQSYSRDRAALFAAIRTAEEAGGRTDQGSGQGITRE